MSDPRIPLHRRLDTPAPNLVGAMVLVLAAYVLHKTAAITHRVPARLGADRLAGSSGLAAFTPQSWAMAATVGAHRRGGVRLHPTDHRDTAPMHRGVGCGRLVRGTSDAVFTHVRRRHGHAGAGPDGGQLADRAGAPCCGQGGGRVCAHPGSHPDGLARGAGAPMAVDQLDIRIVLIALAALGVALTSPLGLGTRGLSSEIASGVYLRDRLLEGDPIQSNDRRAMGREVGILKTLLVLDVTLASEPGKNERSADLGSSSNGMDRIYPAHIP